MKYIRTPTGAIFKYDDCELFDDDFCNKSEVFFNTENQENLAKELFENIGILIGGAKGGENIG